MRERLGERLKTATPGDNLWSKVLTYNPLTRRRRRRIWSNM